MSSKEWDEWFKFMVIPVLLVFGIPMLLVGYAALFPPADFVARPGTEMPKALGLIFFVVGIVGTIGFLLSLALGVLVLIFGVLAGITRAK